ncbi:sugar phosphate nucleotidyltransferase [Anthocerotibacter panamensis]|uniref:sugar phosphate nucleotidyltransferase n=1 Tax=Anthocerotibacter panamensis TaxID=2857077 RepID=UPI001C407E9B|nr:NDP-sugar synthase [Anthocerotibacter panamensis]
MVKAFILAAGKGTRLRPFTDAIPKPLIPVMNRPVMAGVLGLCVTHGIEAAVANLHYRGDHIEQFFGNGEPWGVKLSYSWEEQLMGTAGGVRRQASFLEDDTFVIISGDLVTNIDLGELIAFHKSQGAMVTMALKEVGDPTRFGVVVTDPQGRIQSFQEKPQRAQAKSRMVNTGIYVMEPEVFNLIPANTFFDFGQDLFPLMLKHNLPIYALETGGYWSDVGTLAQYLYTHWDLLTHPTIRERIGENTIIEPGAIVSSNALIGRNCHIRSGAQVLGYSCIGDGTVVEAGGKVLDSIVWAFDSLEGEALDFSLPIAEELIRTIRGNNHYIKMGVPALA